MAALQNYGNGRRGIGECPALQSGRRARSWGTSLRLYYTIRCQGVLAKSQEFARFLWWGGKWPFLRGFAAGMPASQPELAPFEPRKRKPPQGGRSYAGWRPPEAAWAGMGMLALQFGIAHLSRDFGIAKR